MNDQKSQDHLEKAISRIERKINLILVILVISFAVVLYQILGFNALLVGLVIVVVTALGFLIKPILNLFK